MSNLARWCFRHRRTVLASWILAVLIIGGASQAVGSKYSNNFSLPKTDSTSALNLLKASFHSQSGESDQIVIHSKTGKITDPAVKTKVNTMLDEVAKLPYVSGTTSPYQGGEISKDGTIGLANVNFTVQGQNVPKSDVQRVIDTAQSINGPNLEVQLGGNAIENAEQQQQQGSSEILGIVFAFIIMVFAFGSLLLPLLPLLSAVLAIGVGTGLDGFLTHLIGIPSFGPILAVLVGLGVGVDYALFIVTRHRNELKAGRTPEEAAVLALNTSGRAVFFAGITVCIALLGMFALNVSFLYGVALSAALVVALTMATSITLLPAMLGFIGMKALRPKDRLALERQGSLPHAPGFWMRWAKFIDGHSRFLSVIALGVIVVVALPFFSLRLGLSDAGNDPTSSTTRQAYNLLAKGFGPGFNGPLMLVGEIKGADDVATFNKVAADVKKEPGVVTVTPTTVSPSGKVAIATVYPSTGPENVKTSSLLHQMRNKVIPEGTSGSNLVVHVGGATAIGTDFSHVLSSKLPLFVGIVVLLAFILLACVFRSLVIPLTASIMNLLSIGAALGVMTATFQYGWGKTPLSLSEAGPIDVFVPVLLFAVLFGLSMDYEVFLVSRMHEEWTKTHDNQRAVLVGQAETGRVITAAAIIMIFVFGSFIFGGSRVIEEVGIGFASAILLDAFVIRTVLVPALMHFFGRANWWLPSWLDRILPRLNVEGSELPPEPEERERVKVLN